MSVTEIELENGFAGREHLDNANHPASDRTDERWDAVVRALHTHYYEPDIEAARALYAAVAAHDLSGQPVWPMAVAPPSSMKTEIVRALEGLRGVHSIDSVTSKTFISGQIRDRADPPFFGGERQKHRRHHANVERVATPGIWPGSRMRTRYRRCL